jgi:hypothetical protein
MKAIGILLTTLLSAVTFGMTANAQQALATRDGWVQVGSVVYPGGTLRMDVPFVVEVETREIGVVAAQYCAPRALASRAVVLDDFTGGGGWTHFANLRFVNQRYVGGYINAFYLVDDHGGPFPGSGAPLVSGLQFSFAQVNPGFARACRLDFYARPSRD